MKRQAIYYGRNHDGYPEKLRTLSDSPSGLYVEGSLPDPSAKSVAVVGARRCTSYGRKQAAYFARILASRGVQVISGLAAGIDAAAHEGALEGGGKTYAVLGCGTDICYPKDNYRLYRQIREEGGLISEYRPGTPPLAFHFPQRNRIISGLADLVVVVEAGQKSGALITADCALEQGKTVFAVPGRLCDPASAGCNGLIAQGAGLALSPEMILEELGVPAVRGKQKAEMILQSFPESFRKVRDCLSEGEKSLEELSASLGMEVPELAGILMALELNGIVEEDSAGYSLTE